MILRTQIAEAITDNETLGDAAQTDAVLALLENGEVFECGRLEGAAWAERALRERLARDIAALAGERPAGAYECYDWDEAIAAAVAVVRGVGEAKP